MFWAIQFSSKSFDTVEHYIGLSDLSSVPNTEIVLDSRTDKRETQLRFCRAGVLQYVLIIAKTSLGCKINKTPDDWCFLCH